jgi:beta-glucosidase/6-phospho-beta-glucosidase/beta-galactosidase
MFATGVENSYPTIAGNVRVDEMEKCGHYARWREDLELVRGLGLRYLRWGPPLYRVFEAPGRYDWFWTDEVMATIRRLYIEPILDLCHFGLPDWLGNFQNAEFPDYFAEYAAACAARYRHVNYWTPINEPLVTALFSARYGWWNERLSSETGFARACLNLARAGRLAMDAIRDVLPDAVFIQPESCEYTHPAEPDLIDQADLLNERRFLPLDLLYGRPLRDDMLAYLWENGMSAVEYDLVRTPPDRRNCILGVDYYALNEHLVVRDGSTGPAGDQLGLHAVARQYYERYRLPLMHTETNRSEREGAARWLSKQWHSVLSLRAEGVPVLGFTWFSLTDQVDWDTALREVAGRVNAVGLFNLDREARPVGDKYRELVRAWTATLDQRLRAAA